jgi:hypothetical protein
MYKWCNMMQPEAISLFAHPDGDHMTLLSVFRGFASILPYDLYKSPLSRGSAGLSQGGGSAARSWCDEHFLSVKVMERAVEIRARLSGMLHTFFMGESSAQRRSLATSQGLSDESALIRR